DPISQKEYYQMRAIFEPHQVRIDRVPGVLDTARDGIPRAYDAQLDAATRLFVRGDDRNPTGKPLAPGVPESLSGSLDVSPVTLPRVAIAPDRRPDVVQSQFDADQKALARAIAALEQLEKTTKDREKLEVAQLDVEVARAQLDARRAVDRAEDLVDC